jgi:hypothetical protein
MSLIQADRTLEPLEFEQFENVTGSVQRLNAPNKATYAYIQAQGGDIRWRDDAGEVTATVGHILAAGDDLWFTADLKKFTFIRENAETATTDVSVSYYVPR